MYRPTNIVSNSKFFARKGELLGVKLDRTCFDHFVLRSSNVFLTNDSDVKNYFINRLF